MEREEEKRKRRGREEEEKKKKKKKKEEEGRRRRRRRGGVWRGSSRSFNMMQNKEVSLSVRLLCCCIQARLPVDIGPRR